MRIAMAWCCGALMVCGARLASAVPEDAKTVYVVGEAEVVLEPDCAEWVVEVVTTGDSPAVAFEANRAMIKRLREIAKKADIEKEDQHFGRPIARRVSRDPTRGQISTGYERGIYLHTEVRCDVRLVLRDLDELESLMVAIHGLGLAYDIRYKSTGYEKALTEAKLKAIERAKKQAIKQVEVLSQLVGPAVSVNVGLERPYRWGGGLFAGEVPEPEWDVAGPDGMVRVRAYAEVYFELKP